VLTLAVERDMFDPTPTDPDGRIDTERPARAGLAGCDRTNGTRAEHYSALGIARACHVEEGFSHE
jgi:hypothetical protein